jgi:hypothetical protein
MPTGGITAGSPRVLTAITVRMPCTIWGVAVAGPVRISKGCR